MIFKTLDDLKGFIPFSDAFTFAQIKPFLESAEMELLIPMVGEAQYNDIDAAYNVVTPSLTADQSALLKMMQAPVAFYAFVNWLPFGQVKISNAGIQIASTEHMKTAFQWQIDDIEGSGIKLAYEHLDKLLAFLEAKRSNYTIWAGDSVSTIYKDCFIPTTDTFNLYCPVIGNSRRNFLFLKPSLYKMEDFKILPLIGGDYLDELKNEAMAGNLTAENKKVYTLIQKALAPLALYDGMLNMSVSITPFGILQFNNKGVSSTTKTKEPVPDPRIKKIQESALRDGETYLETLQAFLKDNIADYPTYSNSSAYNEEGISNIDNNPSGDFFAAI